MLSKTLNSPPNVGGVPTKRGRWYDSCNNTPSASLPNGSSVAQSTALPSLGTDWHLANPLKASLRPLI